MTSPKDITTAEWQIMKLLWRRAPRTAQELVAELAANWSESTVKTFLNRLVRKGAVTYAVEGKAFLYAPAFTAEECRAAESTSFLNRIFDGALSPMLAHFVESHQLSDAELAELERLVRRKRKKS